MAAPDRDRPPKGHTDRNGIRRQRFPRWALPVTTVLWVITTKPGRCDSAAASRGARAQVGENDGAAGIEDLLSHLPPRICTTPVYGCEPW